MRGIEREATFTPMSVFMVISAISSSTDAFIDVNDKVKSLSLIGGWLSRREGEYGDEYGRRNTQGHCRFRLY